MVLSSFLKSLFSCIDHCEWKVKKHWNVQEGDEKISIKKQNTFNHFRIIIIVLMVSTCTQYLVIWKGSFWIERVTFVLTICQNIKQYTYLYDVLILNVKMVKKNWHKILQFWVKQQQTTATQLFNEKINFHV